MGTTSLLSALIPTAVQRGHREKNLPSFVGPRFPSLALQALKAEMIFVLHESDTQALGWNHLACVERVGWLIAKVVVECSCCCFLMSRIAAVWTAFLISFMSRRLLLVEDFHFSKYRVYGLLWPLAKLTFMAIFGKNVGDFFIVRHAYDSTLSATTDHTGLRPASMLETTLADDLSNCNINFATWL